MMEVDSEAIDYLMTLFGDSEDPVNVYLAHCLYNNSREEYRLAFKLYLFPNPAKLLVRMQESIDPTVRYFYWKLNADHILMYLAIWYDVGHDGLEAPDPYDKFMFKDYDAYLTLCEDYYRTAAHLHKKLYPNHEGRAVGKVLWSLGTNTLLYVTRLRLLRKEYMLFLNEYENEDFGRFVEGIE